MESPQAAPHSICGMSQDEYLVAMEEFHGHASPGTTMGGFMVDAAWRILGDVPYLNAAVETVVCLPDAVQMLTPCTMGNGFLQVMDWGKFALTLYDRESLEGARAWLSVENIEAHPLVANWYLRRPENREVEKEDVVRAILDGGFELIKARPVKVLAALKDKTKVPTVLCPACGEYHPQRQGDLCLACGGQAYYVD